VLILLDVCLIVWFCSRINLASGLTTSPIAIDVKE